MLATGNFDVPTGFVTLEHETPLQDRVIVASLCQYLNAETVVEVGCYVGMTTLSIAQAVPQAQIHCIDHFRGNEDDRLGEIAEKYGPDHIFKTFCRNMGDRLFRSVHPHAGTSSFMASLWPWPVDLVFIDAAHDYESVVQDIELWSKHVRKGGILCGHDFGVFAGVDRAVREIAPAEHNGRVWWKHL